jgi:hypothetical protein
MSVYSRYSYRKRDIELLLSLTDSFTWEELPTRDPATGYLTKAGYIPIIQKLTKFLPTFILGFHIVQSTFRVALYHDMVLTSWYPFDISESPIYEIVNLTQVIFNTYNNWKLICSSCKELLESTFIFQMIVFQKVVFNLCDAQTVFYICHT